MDIHTLLLQRQKTLFVGRKKELAILKQTIADPNWHLLHIYGPGGIGKTTLLRLFAQTTDPARCFFFDGHNGFHSPDEFILKLEGALSQLNPTLADPIHAGNSALKATVMIDSLNHYAVQHQGLTLLLDTFEKWGVIENWLRNEFFLKLNPLIKVITAGRYPLRDQWMRNDWNLLVQNIELQPLSSVEVQTYANIRGIKNSAIINSLQQFSRGMPLALSMACEIIIRNGRTHFLDQPQQAQMIGYLASELTRDIHNASLKRYIEAAAVVWKFDQELLQTLLNEDITADQFREFCGLSFVIRHENQWTLHDSVRKWTFTDLRSRMPQTFRLYRKRALDALREREVSTPQQRVELAFEKIFLHEIDFVRDFCFQWDDSLKLHECTTQDAEQIEQLYLKYLRNQRNYIQGEIHLEHLIRPLLEIDPTAFLGLWQEERLVAFCSCIPLTDKTVRIFQSNPITLPVTSRFDPKQPQYLISIAGLATDLEGEISGSIARAMAKIINRNALILDVISMPDWIPLLPLLGFERVQWADSATPMGVQYWGYQLDLRTEDFPSVVDRMFTASEAVNSAYQAKTKPLATQSSLSMEETVKVVQRTLKHFSRLPFDPEISGSLRSLMNDHCPNTRDEVIAKQMQQEILSVLQRFSSGTKEEQLCYQILHYAYIQKIGTHETVAEYLNISSPSYFRYLRSAVRKLAYELIKPKLDAQE